jgi:hypothetical protein
MTAENWGECGSSCPEKPVYQQTTCTTKDKKVNRLKSGMDLVIRDLWKYVHFLSRMIQRVRETETQEADGQKKIDLSPLLLRDL